MEKIFVDDINYGEYKIFRSNGCLGLYDSADNQLLPFMYDAFEYDKRIIQSTIVVIQNSKKGVFFLSRDERRPSRVLIPAFYDSITKEQITTTRYKFFALDLFYCYRDKIVDIWDESGTMIFSDIIDEVLFATESKRDVLFIGVRKSGKCGVVSSALRQIALPCVYDEVSEPINGPNGTELFVVSKNGLQGVAQIASTPPYNMQVLPIEFEELHAVDKYIIVKNDGRYGIRDHNEPLTGCDFDTYGLFVDSCYTDSTDSPIYVSLSRNGIYYLFQEKDRLIEIPGKIKEIYSDKCLVFEKDGHLGIANFEGKILLRNIYTKIAHQPDEDVCFGDVFEPSVFRLEQQGKQGLFSLTFDTLIPCTYDSIHMESERSSLYLAKTRNGFSIYDNKLSRVIPLGYERYQKFEYVCDSEMRIDTFFKVYLQGKVGLYSLSGQCVPCTYDSVDIIDLSDCYRLFWLRDDDVKYLYWFVVSSSGKKGLINYNGEVLIPCVCEDISLSYDLEVRYMGNVYRGLTLSQIDEILSEGQNDD